MSQTRDLLRRNGGTVFLLAVLALSLGTNVVLGGLLEGGRLPWSPPPPQPLRAGAQLPGALPLETADGTAVTLSFAGDSRPTVLYILSPLCEWCKRNEANIKALVAETGQGYRYVGISFVSDGLREYVAQGSAPFPVYYAKSESVGRELRILGTPETIIVSPRGRVVKVWTGAYVQPNIAQVERFFHVKLPGLPQNAATN